MYKDIERKLYILSYTNETLLKKKTEGYTVKFYKFIYFILFYGLSITLMCGNETCTSLHRYFKNTISEMEFLVVRNMVWETI